MSAGYAEQYVTVTALLLELRDKSLRIDNEALPAPVWLPLYALEFSCSRLLRQDQVGQPVALKIKGDMAQQKGLV